MTRLASSFDWFIALCTSCDWPEQLFSFGFTTLKRKKKKALSVSNSVSQVRSPLLAMDGFSNRCSKRKGVYYFPLKFSIILHFRVEYDQFNFKTEGAKNLLKYGLPTGSSL